MQLYTINNTYPDKNFHFTVSPATLGASPAVHQHDISAVSSLASSLAAIPNAATAIIAGGTVFTRDEGNDNAVDNLYAWTDTSSNTYWTTVMGPSSGVTLYNSSGVVVVGATVESYVAGHTHTCLNSFIGNDGQKIYGAVVIGSDHATVSVTNGTVSVAYTSPQTGVVAGVMDINPNDAKGIFQFYHGDIRDLPENTDTNIITI